MSGFDIKSAQIGLDDISMPTSADATEVADMVRTFGACRIPGLLSPTALGHLNEHFDRFFAETHPDIRIDYAGDPFFLANVIKTDRLLMDFPWLSRIFFNQFCRTVATDYFRGPVELNFQFYATENHGVEQRAYDNMFLIHFDAYSTIKFMVYLWDVDADCGPFEIVPGSHRTNIESRLRQLFEGKVYDELVSDLPYRDVETLPLVGPAGTMIVFDTDVSHRAGFCRPGRKRRLIRAHTDSEPTWKLRWNKATAAEIGRPALVRHLA